MRVAILCGGKGTRLAELTEGIPKGLIPVGERPIIWHIMKYFASFGCDEFVLLVGYMGNKFVSYFQQDKDLNWKIQFVDSGCDATKSERIVAARRLLDGGPFFLAYGDDLSDVNLAAVAEQNLASQAVVTLTAVRPVSPYGVIRLGRDNVIERFEEKIRTDEWINGGFMAVKPELLDSLGRGEFETVVLPELAARGKVNAHLHHGFWMSMNTFKESQELGAIWARGDAPWKRWED